MISGCNDQLHLWEKKTGKKVKEFPMKGLVIKGIYPIQQGLIILGEYSLCLLK